MSLRPLLLAAALLGWLCCAPARADWLRGFAHIACIPEAGALRIEHIAVSGSDFFSDSLAGDANYARRLKAWQKHGFHDEGRADLVCKLPNATYRIRLRKPEGSERGMCAAAPAARLSLSINGKPLLDGVTFGDDCGDEPNVRTIALFDGAGAQSVPVMSLCIGFAPYSGQGDPVCHDLRGQALRAPARIDDARIGEIYEADRPR